MNHRQIIKHLEDQLGKDLELRIRELTYNNGNLEGIFEHPIFKGVAVLCADLIKSTGPDKGNFVTCNLHYEGQRYELTVQKAWGKTPADRIEELENEINQYKQNAGNEEPSKAAPGNCEDLAEKRVRQTLGSTI